MSHHRHSCTCLFLESCEQKNSKSGSEVYANHSIITFKGVFSISIEFVVSYFTFQPIGDERDFDSSGSEPEFEGTGVR